MNKDGGIITLYVSELTMFATFALICIVVFAALTVAGLKPRGFPPGPLWFPIVGCWPQLRSAIARQGYFHMVWDEFASKYGPLVGLRMGLDRAVIVSGGEAVKHVYSRDDCDGRPEGFYFRMRTFGEKLGIFSIDGPIWREQRSFTTRHMRQLGIGKDAMENLVGEESEALINSVREKCIEYQNKEMPLNKLFDIAVVNCLWAVVAGKRFDLRDERLNRLLSLVSEFFKHIDWTGGALYQIPALRFIAPELTGYKPMITCITGLQEFLRDTVKEHQSTFHWENTRDLIDAYLHKMSTKELNSMFTEKQLLSVCIDFFMAGSETTSNTLAFIIQYMLKYPEVQKRVQQEIDNVIGHERSPTLADRPLMPYTEATIMEVQRINTSVPLPVPHKTLKDCDILGYQVPRNTILFLSVYSVHMDRDHWGDPENFRPERFLDSTGEKIISDDWFMPFGNGKHRCIGEVLARNTIFVFFTALLQNFTFSLPPGQEAPTYKHVDGLTLAPGAFTGIVTPR